MDKFWSLFAMPIGVAICFGPVIVVWLLSEWKSSSTENPEDRQ